MINSMTRRGHGWEGNSAGKKITETNVLISYLTKKNSQHQQFHFLHENETCENTTIILQSASRPSFFNLFTPPV